MHVIICTCTYMYLTTHTVILCMYFIFRVAATAIAHMNSVILSSHIGLGMKTLAQWLKNRLYVVCGCVLFVYMMQCLKLNGVWCTCVCFYCDCVCLYT